MFQASMPGSASPLSALMRSWLLGYGVSSGRKRCSSSPWTLEGSKHPKHTGQCSSPPESKCVRTFKTNPSYIHVYMCYPTWIYIYIYIYVCEHFVWKCWIRTFLDTLTSCWILKVLFWGQDFVLGYDLELQFEEMKVLQEVWHFRNYAYSLV